MRNSVKVITIVGFLLGMQMQAQQVRLTRVDKVVENADKTFYRIDPVLHEAQLLGEIEVDGYNRNTVEAFNKVYTKAKQTGANAFAVHPYETIDGGLGRIDPAYFRLLLYYTDNRSVENVNAVYLFSGVEQPQTISINTAITRTKVSSAPITSRRSPIPPRPSKSGNTSMPLSSRTER